MCAMLSSIVLAVFIVCLGVNVAFRVRSSGRKVFTSARTSLPAIGGNEYSLDELGPIESIGDKDNNTINTRIFCNVELDLSSLEAIGFDMDFTLAQVDFWLPMALNGTK